MPATDYDFPPHPSTVLRRQVNPDLTPLDSTDDYLYQRNNPDVPDWLSCNPPDKPKPEPLPLTVYADMFEWVCDRISGGESITDVLNRDPRNPDVGRFIRWIMKDEKRKAQYYEAQAINAEILFEDMVRIADANESIEDVQRSRLKLETRWKKMAVCNRDRFGDIKKIDQNITIDLSDAISRANQRVIDVTPGYDNE